MPTLSFPYQLTSWEEYSQAYTHSVEYPEAFWGQIASHFVWKRKWDRVLEWNFTDPSIVWFKNGQLNITENCLDRYAESQPGATAIVWEPNNSTDSHRVLTYGELLVKVMQFAHVLKNNGIGKGDRVCIYMGMIPELTVAVLACARVGAIHSVIFGGFSAQSIADRIIDLQAKAVITCDGAYRGEKTIPLKDIMDEALEMSSGVEKVIVYSHTKTAIRMKEGRDVWWDAETSKVESQGKSFFAAEPMDSEDILFILYTSGSTGKPKGVVHTVAGYMVWAHYTFVNVFQYKPGEVHFCTADIGWITGHTYMVYGPLSAGATTLLFEGIPTWPTAGRFWDIVQKFRVSIFYTAPTAIRSLMSYGEEPLLNKDFSSLRVLGTVGEPINEEAWHWYDTYIGQNRCSIVDTWWQTETGGVMISNLAGITPSKPTFATYPLPGVQPVLLDEKGNLLTGNNVSGHLCIEFPWPGMMRTTYGDHERFRKTYFESYRGYYFTGDGCLRDEKGMYRITGRVDDVLNVSGHRIGTAEVENAIDRHPGVIESAVVGYGHDVKGQGIYAYIVYRGQMDNAELLRKSIVQTVTRILGSFAKPEKIQFVTGLPKTRSGKIMRRILRKIAENDFSQLGDTSTLLDPEGVEAIKEGRV